VLQITTIFFLLALAILAGAHFLALTFFLYWKLWWFDVVMHFFGGITVTLGFFTLKDIVRQIPERFLYAIPMMAGALFVILAWEIFEYQFGLFKADGYVFDTVTDIVLGTMGAFLGFLLGHKLREL
jgi:uncharacterized membrane protein YjjP (DUF1212 family)